MATDLVSVQIPREEYERIVTLAQQRGYETPNAYLLALVEDDAEEAWDDEEDDPVGGFQRAWHQAMTGESYPVEEVWKILRQPNDDDQED